MSLIDEVPSRFAAIDIREPRKELSDEIAKQTEEFLARGGKVYFAKPNETIDIPLFTVISRDGDTHNDYHSMKRGAINANRKKERGDVSGIALFSEPKRKPSVSGRMYIKTKVVNGNKWYITSFDNVKIGKWTMDIEEAVGIRNKSLTKQGRPLPD